MKFDVSKATDSLIEGTKEVAETAHTKTSEFHEKYVSSVIPDLGKYGDAAKFVAEMAPGVSEYNAIREGDWQAFAIAAGIDVAAAAVGFVTAGTGYAAVKSGSVVAKTGVKAAAKEISDGGTKKVVKEVAEAGAEKAVKEVAEAGVERVAKEVVEAGAEKAAKEAVEAGAEKAAKEVVEAGAEKAAKEVVEVGTEKAVKEVAETGAEKTVKEVLQEGTENAVKEVNEISQVVKNKWDGIKREEEVLEKLLSKYGQDNVLREQLLRDKLGKIIIDPVTGAARRIDFIVVEKGGKVLRSIEVTSETASKTVQTAKELRILERARDLGGAFIRDSSTGQLYEFGKDLVTEIVRL